MVCGLAKWLVRGLEKEEHNLLTQIFGAGSKMSPEEALSHAKNVKHLIAAMFGMLP